MEKKTHADSQRLAEKRRWMARSSISDWERRYESIILPIGVVRSKPIVSGYQDTNADEMYDTRLPGNLTSRTGVPSDLKRSSRSANCVLFPDLSRPSTAMNEPRIFLPDISALESEEEM